ncbi:MAG: aspartate aminotransferase, partial [Spirochaetales bacterium]
PEAGFNVEGFARALEAPGEKKVVLFNFPNNPTGYTPVEAEMDALVAALEKAAAAGKHVLVILDDAYFGLVFREGIGKESLFPRLASLHENLLVCKVDGATKEDYVWGFRVGFITFAGKGAGEKALSALADKAAGAVRGSISNDSHLAQSLLLTLYNDPEYAGEKQRAFELVKSRFDAVNAELAAHPEYRERFVPLPYNSGYFMCVKVACGDAEAVRQKLLNKYDTGVIALGDLVRVAYSSLPVALIPRLFANLYAACGEV